MNCEYIKSISIPTILEVSNMRMNTKTKINKDCIRYSNDNISLNFKNKLKHTYVKHEGMHRVKDFIEKFNENFISDRIVYNLFRCIHNDALIKSKMRIIKLLLYQIVGSKNKNSPAAIQYMIYVLWLVILNGYDWE